MKRITFRQLLCWLAVWLLLAYCMLAAGCKVPPGTQRQIAGMGLDFAPLGDAPQAPKLRIGSFASQFALPVPDDAGASLVRSDLQGPLGVRQTSTQASGAVGREFERGDGALVDTVRALHGGGEQPPAKLAETPGPVSLQPGGNVPP